MKVCAGPRPERRRGWGRALRCCGLLVLVSVGCETRAEKSAEKSKAHEAPPAASVDAAPPAAPAPKALAAPALGPKLRALDDASHARLEPTLHAKERLALDEPVALHAGEVVSLTFDAGASLQVAGQALFAVPTGREAGTLLNRGTLSLDLERAALHPESGFWLATPALRIELVQGARLALRSFEDGSTRLAVVSGQVSVVSADAAQEPRKLQAGEVLHADALGALTKAPRLTQLHLETARTALASLPEPRASARASGSALEAALLAACEAMESARAQTRALLREHQALGRGEAEDKRGVQERLAQAGAHAFRDRQALLRWLSMFEAESLHAPAEGTHRALIARARALLR